MSETHRNRIYPCPLELGGPWDKRGMLLGPARPEIRLIGRPAMPSDLQRLAYQLDPERVGPIARDLNGRAGADLGLVLAAAYPALVPQRPALFDAIAGLA